MSRQIPFTRHEAVLLLNAYLCVQEGHATRMEAVRQCSGELRAMAVNNGLTIDDTYRNLRGISFQMASMESAYQGKTITVPATRLFIDTVELYQIHNVQYHQLLKEAQDMANQNQGEEDMFMSWLSENVSPVQLHELSSALREIELQAKKIELIEHSLYEVRDLVTAKRIRVNIEQSKIFKFTHKKQWAHIILALNYLMQYINQSAANTNIDKGEVNLLKVAKIEKNEEIVKVLRAHYEYGFKYDSIREIIRFRQFADAMEIALPEEDKVLRAFIMASGVVIDDKVYCKSDDMLQDLQRMVDNAFSSGAGVIYYECLFENEQEWMESYVLTSPEILKKYLQNNITGCSFSRKFMVKGSRRSEREAVTDEIKRIWGIHPIESVCSLHSRLPYIPQEIIWRVISGNELFAWASEGEYLFVDRFHITPDEEENILAFVDESCEKSGFASLSNVPLGGIEEENYELNQTAIYNAIYKKVLSGKYYLNGKILTKEKSELDVVMLLKQYLKDKDECTFDEVADKVVELTGSTNRQYAFQALYDDMVRVDRNRFVANRFVNFSIDEIDTVLAGFITDNFRAIRDVTTFVMFPLCGQSWNHYLLESFCYKYSRKYSLHVINFNDKNAGIIAEKEFNKKYSEMLAIALARTNVELSPEVIGQYLFDMGYMAKRKYGKLGEIAQCALELRKER